MANIKYNTFMIKDNGNTLKTMTEIMNLIDDNSFWEDMTLYKGYLDEGKAFRLEIPTRTYVDEEIIDDFLKATEADGKYVLEVEYFDERLIKTYEKGKLVKVEQEIAFYLEYEELDVPFGRTIRGWFPKGTTMKEAQKIMLEDLKEEGRIKQEEYKSLKKRIEELKDEIWLDDLPF